MTTTPVYHTTALMPGGDHLNIIDPPGLTVMRIAGGRYRVTAAHRVIWTWMNEFAPLAEYPVTASTSSPAPHYRNNEESVNSLQLGDLVSMTIVDVFETDNQGKLLSYCPTFDNRAVHKTHPTTETLRRGGSQLLSMLGKAQHSKTAELIFKNARNMAQTVKQKVDQAVYNYQSPKGRSNSPPGPRNPTLKSAVSRDDSGGPEPSPVGVGHPSVAGSSNYVADDDMERHEI